MSVFALMLYLHGSLQPAVLVVSVVNWFTGADVALLIIESFAGSSYRFSRVVGSVIG